ncbi:ABC transporter ATP-binding protein [Roseinatronobacter sp. NSM]|uniref:ABC transporter ATP-binding protein n=1 Tax=Roseinatronobacter sp. NSM TaxID=3457785 RepID=UPI004035889A
MSAPFLSIRNLGVAFTGGTRPVRAVNDVSLDVAQGEAVALIGESGSGKSVTMRAIMRLNPEKRTKLQGSIDLDGRDILKMTPRELQALRGAQAAMIFQEPLLALDPVYSLGDQIVETIRRHEPISRDAARARALELFERVRIPSARSRLDNYPHEMSGGMRQRAMIALALSCRPKLLLADEPTTALDATVQIQVLLLLRELQRDLGLSIIFVTHDIGAAVEVADRIAVMYAGQIVEQGSARELIRTPRHPYTLGLLKSRADGAMVKGARLEAIPGAPPDLAHLPDGCPFAPRCFLAETACHAGQIEMQQIGTTHQARCRKLAQTRDMQAAQ